MLSTPNFPQSGIFPKLKGFNCQPAFHELFKMIHFNLKISRLHQKCFAGKNWQNPFKRGNY